MGSGASKKAKAKKPGEDAPGADEEEVDHALRRRRKLLFGQQGPRPFEQVPPKEQFSAMPEINDPIFNRLPDYNKLRMDAESVQFAGNDGYLDVNAIELLGLGLEQDSPLSKRLFKMAQVQHIDGKVNHQERPRRPLMTCYELLALMVVIRSGSEDDLLELLYCVFDIDGDDCLSVEDLTSTIDTFLGLQDATSRLEKPDQDDFKKLDEKARHAEAKRIAEQAIAEYGTVGGEPLEGEELSPEPAEEAPTGKDADAATPTTAAPEASPEARRSESFKSPRDGEDEDDEDAKSYKSTGNKSNWSTMPVDGGDKGKVKPTKKKGGLCSGPPPDDTSGDEALQPPPLPADKAEEKPGEKPDAKADPKADAKAKAKAKAKPKAKAKAKQSGGCALCGGGGRGRKAAKALNYTQWRKWLAASELLPAGFGAAALAGEAAAAGPAAEGAAAAAVVARPTYAVDDDDDSVDSAPPMTQQHGSVPQQQLTQPLLA